MMNVMLSYNNEGEFLYNLICKIMEKKLEDDQATACATCWVVVVVILVVGPFV